MKEEQYASKLKLNDVGEQGGRLSNYSPFSKKEMCMLSIVFERSIKGPVIQA